MSIDAELAHNLETDADFRREYIRLFAQSAVAAEIRGLRKLRRLKQIDVARLVRTGQSAISRIEKADYDSWTFKTLLAIAVSLRARLRVQLEPIEVVIDTLRSSDNDTVPTVESGGGTADLAEVMEWLKSDPVTLDSGSTAEETYQTVN